MKSPDERETFVSGPLNSTFTHEHTTNRHVLGEACLKREALAIAETPLLASAEGCLSNLQRRREHNMTQGNLRFIVLVVVLCVWFAVVFLFVDLPSASMVNTQLASWVWLWEAREGNQKSPNGDSRDGGSIHLTLGKCCPQKLGHQIFGPINTLAALAAKFLGATIPNNQLY